MSTNRRVAVTSPQTRLAHARRRHRARWRPATLDPAEAQRAVRLYRAQRRRSTLAVALLFALIFGLPVLLAAFPALDGLRLLGVPASWIAVAVVPFPAMVSLAWWQLRRAERAEDDG
ncbi:hypothetical protein [Amycolatopsis cihanbeyliensis]|uniref:DUF485 domain-containing protein n=1 Tax=Amycolatopsis cihanbeyliensis TaxID=1128664 RepID=A0A542DCR1_AMYCI|nr:hypothetical protein [Amycolatopsis cihanbeyliensis]TQJ00860.1 hypothetical protein FB471_0511 [Amycolatopsis cihanbeyliensis]